VNYTLGGGFLDDGNGTDKALSGFICRVIAHGSPYFFHRSFGLGLVTYISESFYFALFGPFEG
jgi:hypothetical protein